MEKGIEKLLRSLVIKKYPMYLDVHVAEYGRFNPNKRICYEVFLVNLEQDFIEDRYYEVIEYVKDVAKYMDVTICGVYNESVTEEEWEEMKLDKKD
jgi:hypothetical protein